MRKKYFYRATALTAFTALFLLLNWGCKKNKPGFYYISYEVNGIPHVDTSGAIALMYANDTMHSYSAHLTAQKSDLGDMVQIVILTKAPLNTTTVYKDTTQTFGTLVDISFYDSPYNFPAHPTLSSYKLFPRNVMIHFTNISASSVKGTFSGNVVSSDNSSVSSITNGVFYLKAHWDNETTSGRDIYIAGYEERSDGNQLIYWKNGVKTIVEKSPALYTSAGITVSANDVFVAATVQSPFRRNDWMEADFFKTVKSSK